MSWQTTVNIILFGVVLPLCLGTCAYLKQNVFSFCYLILYFTLPWWKIVKLGLVLKLAVGWCVAVQVTQLVFQILCFFFKKHISISYCTTLEIVLRHIGLIEWGSWDLEVTVVYIVPDFIVMVIFIEILRRHSRAMKKERVRRKYLGEEIIYDIPLGLGKSAITLLLISAAIVNPSLIGLFYFLLALATGLMLACKDRTFFSCPVLISILLLVICHLVALFAMQTQWVQKIMPPDVLKIGNLTAILRWDCSRPYEQIHMSVSWEAYAIGPILLALYAVSASVLRIKILTEDTLFSHLRDLWGNASRINATSPVPFSDEDGSQRRGLWKAVMNLNCQKYMEDVIAAAACSCMLIWSVVFLELTSLVMLVWGAGLCLLPKMKSRTLRSSLLLVLYAYFLVTRAYIHNVPAIEKHLPVHPEEGGPGRTLSLFIKSLFTAVFLLLLRQYVNERSRKEEIHGETSAVENVTIQTVFLQTFLKRTRVHFVVWWILIVIATVLLFICTGETVTVLRIIYVMLFLFFIIVFQFSYDGWRNLLSNYCLSLCIITLLAIILKYPHVFDSTGVLWTYIGISEELQKKLGFEGKAKDELRFSLLKLSSILIALMIQIQCNLEFLEATNVRKKMKESYNLNFIENLLKRAMIYETKTVRFVLKILLFIFNAAVFVLKYGQLHLLKILVICLAWMTLRDISLLHWVLFVLALTSQLLRRRYRVHLMKFCTTVVAVHTVQQMLATLVELEHRESVCTQTITKNFSKSPIQDHYNGSFLSWAGLLPSGLDAASVNRTIFTHISVIMISTTTIAISRYLMYRGFLKGEITRQSYVLFPHIERSDADYDVKTCVKFLINYFFYKFGIEICLIAMTAAVGRKRDVYALANVIWVTALCTLRRNTIAKVWKYLVYYTYASLIIQYAFFLHFPADICIAYPWYTNREWRIVQDWLSLPDPFQIIDKNYLIYSVLLFILMTRQAVVFSIEEKYGAFYPGGWNGSPTFTTDDSSFINPVPDYLTFVRSWLDIWKHCFFVIIFWITLIVIFLTSSWQVSIFSIGYLIASFVMFWRGDDFYLYSTHTRERQWNWIIGYNLSVILTKVLAQLTINMLVKDYKSYILCVLLRIVSISPLTQSQQTTYMTKAITFGEECTSSPGSEIAWDIVCFAFLIVTRRIFTTYYFAHIVNDAKATAVISSRGAQMFDRICLHRIAIQNEKEKEVIEHLTMKMDALRSKQERLQLNPLFVSPISHYEAIHAGDYFMFNEREMQEEDEQRARLEEIESQEKEARRRSRELNLFFDATLKGTGAPANLARITLRSFLEETRRASLEETVKNFRKNRMDVQVDAKLLTEAKEPQEEGEKKITVFQRLEIFVIWVYYFIDSGVLSLALAMYGYTKDYRYVVNELSEQKKSFLVTGSLEGHRVRESDPWTPDVGEQRRLSTSVGSSFPDPEMLQADLQSTAEKAQGQFLRTSHQSSYFSLLTSILYMILAYSELICYFIIILHQLLEPTFLSLIMSMSLFLWATLSTSRPSKTFWVSLLAYVQIVIVIKTVIQFEYVELIGRKSERWTVIGLHISDTTTLLDLLLLVSLLFHRIRLKKFGLWERWPTDGVTEFPDTYFSTVDDSTRSNLSRGTSEEFTIRISNTSIYRMEKPVPVTKYFPSVLTLVIIQHRNIVIKFFKDLLTSPTRFHVDVYSWMFFLDVLCILLTLFGISHFGVTNNNWWFYFDRNRFPLSIFVLLFGQFCLLVIDRIIYVRKNVVAKLIFHVTDVVILHTYLFIFLPITAYKRVNSSVLLQTFYLTKSLYFLVSAYQIRCGYAVYEHGYLFRKKYGIFHLVFHKVLMTVPFFFELRTTLDWLASVTTFTFMEFFKMEDVYNNAYAVKCQRSFEKSFPIPRGTKKRLWVTLTLGGGVLVGLVLVLWFPLILFRLRHELGISKAPVSLNLQLQIDMFPPIFEGKSYILRQFSKTEWDSMTHIFKNSTKSQDALQYFDAADIVVAKLTLKSGLWTATPESRDLMASDLRNHDIVTFKLIWELEYGSNDVVRGYKISTLDKSHPDRIALADMIADVSGTTKEFVVIPGILPKFLDASQVGSSPDPESSVSRAFLNHAYRSVELSLLDTKITGKALSRQMSASNSKSDSEMRLSVRVAELLRVRLQVWQMKEVCRGPDWEDVLRKLPEADCEGIVIYALSEKQFGFWMDLLSSKGSLAIYYLIVVSMWQFLRRIMRGTTQKLLLTEMPYPDRLLELCHDIYAVRIAKCFDLEEDLFAKLLFLLRSPETLAMFTRKPLPLDRDRDT